MGLPVLKFLLLRLLEKGPRSGYELMKEVERILGRVSPGAVYPLLRWWEERGFVERKEKYYLTEKGRDFLSEMERKRREYIEKIRGDLMALARALKDPDTERLASYLPLREKIGEEGTLVLVRVVELLAECGGRERVIDGLKDLLSEWEELC